MDVSRVILLTSVAMLAFAANSLLARVGVRDGLIDAGSFTALRLVSGALGLWILVAWQTRSVRPAQGGRVVGALALFVYAAAFSVAYLDLTAAMGALLLFGAVQLTMIAVGLWRGDPVTGVQWVGVGLAFSGLIGLLLPGLSAPPLGSAAVMLLSGVAWGIYSLLGRGVSNPLAATAHNFLLTVPLALVLVLLSIPTAHYTALGGVYAVLSGVLASGAGYAIWYSALPALSSPVAATVQLSVPVIAAVGGVLLLAEPVSLRLVLGSVAVLGGVALVIVSPVWRRASAAPPPRSRVDRG